MRDTIDEVIAYIDGGSRGNPGPAAAGFVLTDKDGNQLCAKGLFLGEATNNVAEYTACVAALEAAKQAGAKKLTVFSDSELLVKQLNGQYRVKSTQLRPLFQQAVNLLGRFENCKVQFVCREKNKAADDLVNRALNLEKDVTVKTEDRRQRTENRRQSPARERRATSDESRIRLGVLISGGGRTLMNILEYIRKGQLNAEVAVVISSHSTVAGVEKAKAAGLNVKIVRKKDYLDIDEFSKRIADELVAANVDLVIQAGWLCLWKIPARYENRVMNIHPALLPSFGGKGMFGLAVHKAVLAAGCKVTGCTVHFCTNEYDKGPIILQRCCPVEAGDSVETLAAKVFEQECIAYPRAIKLFARRMRNEE